MIYLEKPAEFQPQFEVVGCFMEHAGKILLLHRAAHKPQGGTWGIPAGKVAKDEDTKQAIVREIREETGIEIDPALFKYYRKIFVSYPDIKFVYHMFQTPLNQLPAVSLDPTSHQAFTWVTPGEALTMNLIMDQDVCFKMFYNL